MSRRQKIKTALWLVFIVLVVASWIGGSRGSDDTDGGKSAAYHLGRELAEDEGYTSETPCFGASLGAAAAVTTGMTQEDVDQWTDDFYDGCADGVTENG